VIKCKTLLKKKTAEFATTLQKYITEKSKEKSVIVSMYKIKKCKIVIVLCVC